MTNRTDLAIELAKTQKTDLKKVLKIGKTELFFSETEQNKSYATIKFGNIDLITDFSDIENAINLCLCELLPRKRDNILVVGLGNREIISDCIGPFTCEKILATRHIVGELSEKIGLPKLKSVSVVAPSVLGKTGIESGEVIACIVNKIKPDAVIVIDALCASNTENLFSVIQLTNSGISPGSGVKNTRKELSCETLGVPTVAIGVPTVVEAGSIVKEFSSEEGKENIKSLLLTPKDTDLLSHRISEVLAKALNIFLQPETDKEVLLSLV